MAISRGCGVFALFAVTVCAPLGAQQLVADLASGVVPAPTFRIEKPKVLGTRCVFFASTPTGAAALFATDGSPNGTRQIELAPAWPASQFASSLGLLFTVATSGSVELWIASGVAGGTRMVAPLPGFEIGSTDVTAWIELPGQVLLTRGGQTLWRTDGTSAGTTLLPANVYKSIGNAPPELARLGSRAFFAGGSPSDVELWCSDGTAPGTQLFYDLRQAGSSYPSNLGVAGGKLFFSADDGVHSREPWATDGTVAGTLLLHDLANGGHFPRSFTEFLGRAWFCASDPDSGEELWVSDGTSAGTRLAVELVAGPASLSIKALVADLAQLFLVSSSALGGGHSLWVTDGTPLGTTVLQSFSTASVNLLRVVSSRLWFSAASAAAGTELWTSDGTVAGTQLALDLEPGPDSSAPSAMVSIAGRLLFLATITAERGGLRTARLVASDGTSARTQLLWPLRPSLPASSEPSGFLAVGARVWFTAASSRGNLWRSDGTLFGTVPVLDPQREPFGPAALERVGDAVHFVASDGLGALGMWRSDGTQQGTWRLADFGYFQTYGGRLSSADGVHLYLTRGADYPYYTLWRSDGTPSGTVALTTFPQAFWAGVLPLGYANDVTYFVGNLGSFSGVPRAELWRTDGTAAGTTQVLGFAGTAAGARSWRGKFYVIARESSGAVQLWQTDGTAQGTIALLVPTLPSLAAPVLAVTDSALVFVTQSAATTLQVWKNPSGAANAHELIGQVTVVAKTYPWIAPLVELPRRVLIAIEDGSGLEPWSIDPVTNQVAQLVDIHPGPGSSLASEYGIVGTKNTARSPRLLFVASEPVHGSELWVTDGTSAGTKLAFDLNPGPGSSRGRDLTRIGTAIWLGADDGRLGNEPWTIPAGLCGVGGVDDLGGGCAIPSGVVPQLLATTAIPAPGAACELELRSAPALATALFLGSEMRPQSLLWNTCRVHVGEPLVTWLTTTDARGGALQTLTLPTSSALIGIGLHLQTATARAPDGLAISNAIRLVVGA